MVIFYDFLGVIFWYVQWAPPVDGWSLSKKKTVRIAPAIRSADGSLCLYAMETHRFSSLIWLICLRLQKDSPTPSFNQSKSFEAPHVPRTSESTHRGSFGHPVRCGVKPSTSWDECSVSIWFSYCHPWSHEKTHRKTFRMEKWSGNQDWLALAVRPLALMILAVLLCFPSSDTDIQHRSPVRLWDRKKTSFCPSLRYRVGSTLNRDPTETIGGPLLLEAESPEY